jgi:peroxiredoxin
MICMHELGELERRAADFKQRGVRVVAVSVDGRDDTDKMQHQFPSVIVLGDPERKMTEAFQVLHARAAPDGSDTAAPTTFLVDTTGKLRWVYRPEHVIVRLTPDELLAAVDKNLLGK